MFGHGVWGVGALHPNSTAAIERGENDSTLRSSPGSVTDVTYSGVPSRSAARGGSSGAGSSLLFNFRAQIRRAVGPAYAEATNVSSITRQGAAGRVPGGGMPNGTVRGFGSGQTDAPSRLSDSSTFARPGSHTAQPHSIRDHVHENSRRSNSNRFAGRSSRPPPVYSVDGSLRLVQMASRVWWGLIFIYALMLLCGVLVAFIDLQRPVMLTLLLTDSVLLIVAYTSVFVRLGLRTSHWPSRFHRSCGMLVVLIIQLALVVSSAFLHFEALTLWATTASGIFLSLALLMLSVWVGDKVFLLIIPAPTWRASAGPPHQPRPIDSHAVDIRCCGWVSSAWPERQPPEQQQTQPQQSQTHRTHTATRPPFTWPLYLRYFWEHLTNSALASGHDALPASRHPPTAPRNHPTYTIHASGLSSVRHTGASLDRGRSHHSSHLPSSSIPAATLLSLPSRPSNRRIQGINYYDSAPADKADSAHKYFCPICMLYHSEVYKTQCCSNYVCQECSLMYISGKRKRAEEEMLAALSMDFDERGPLISSHIVECPYCQKGGMVLTRVNPWEGIKTYEDSEVSSLASSMSYTGSLDPSHSAALKGKGAARGGPDPKKVAIGDDFAALRRKIDFTGFAIAEVHSDGGEVVAGVGEGAPGRLLEMEAEGDDSAGESSPVAAGSPSSITVDGVSHDVLLPNETDHYPKGPSPAPSPKGPSTSRGQHQLSRASSSSGGSSTSSGSSVSGGINFGEAPSLELTAILESGISVAHGAASARAVVVDGDVAGRDALVAVSSSSWAAGTGASSSTSSSTRFVGSASGELPRL